MRDVKNDGKERDKIEELVKSAGASPGDTIAIEERLRGISIEGELMPKGENNAPDVIVVKLRNGYNIGIKYSEDMKIRKLKSGTIPTFPEATIDTKGKPKIGLIYTGGTIGSKIDYKTGGVHMLLKPGELIHEVPEIGGVAEIEVKKPFQHRKRRHVVYRMAEDSRERCRDAQQGKEGCSSYHWH